MNSNFKDLLVYGPLVWGAKKAVATFSEKNKDSSSSSYQTSDYDHMGEFADKPKEPSDAEMSLIIFTALLLKAAAVCDGKIKKNELAKIDECLSTFSKQYYFAPTIVTDNELFRRVKIDITDLTDYYRAIPLKTQERKEYWLELVESMLREDHKINDAENAFLFSLKMFFMGRKIPEIYKVVQQPVDFNEVSINYITHEDVAEKYPFTNLSRINPAQFYTPHPSGIKELVSFDYLLEQSFVSSKHTELIEVARQAGAKSIQIMSAEKTSLNSNIDASAGGSFTNPSQVKVSGSTSFSKKGFSDAELKSGITIEFEGNRAHKDSDWLGRTAQQILLESRWLAYDDELTTFVHNCFGENRVMHFELEVDVTDVQQASISASIAAECHMAEMAGGSANASFGKSKEQSKLTHIKYVIDFE